MDENTNGGMDKESNEESIEKTAKSESDQVEIAELDKFDLDKKFPDFKGWEMIGFHRQLGSEFWNILLQIVTTALSVILSAYLAPLIAPYPEISGYTSIAQGLFLVVFTIFDVATTFGVGQFVAQYRVSNPEKMMEYIRFFVWWQMMAGILQVTFLSIYTLEIIIYGQYGYLTWLLLIILQQQWPCMLGIFTQCISGFQHFDKANIINFLQQTVVGQLLNVAIVLFGRYEGMIHPEIGEIIGMAIAGCIGQYINNILFFFVSVHYFNGITRKMGYTAIDAFRFKFGKDVIRTSLNYGIQSSIVPVIAGVTSLLFLIWKTSMIPGYVAWNALISTGSGMTSSIGTFGNFSVQTALAEAYPNGKKKLTEFYISYSMKWRLLFMSMMCVVLLAVYPYFSLIYHNVSGLVYWVPALLFYYPGLARQWFNPFFNLTDYIMLGTFKIKQWTIARICEECMKVVNLYVLLFILSVQITWGLAGITFLLCFDAIIPTTIKTAGCWIYCNKKIAKIKIYWMSSIVIPSLAASPMFLFSWLWLQYVFYPLWAAVGVIFAATISIIVAFGFMFFIMYFPILAILGGFDDYMFYVFKKSVELSGPSKPMMRVIERLVWRTIKAAKKIKVHGHFGIPYEEAHKEIEELMQLKQEGKMLVMDK